MKERVLKYARDRFGIPDTVFTSLDFVESSGIWVASRRALRFPLKHPVRRGIRLGRILKKGVKLTTAALQVFGRHATRNLVPLDREAADLYLRGHDLDVGGAENVENGQVTVLHEEHVLGSGMYRDGHVKNQIPKARRIIN